MILQHPRERRNTVGSARIAHLSIKNSILITGLDFETHEGVQALLRDPAYAPMVLYPGPRSFCLTPESVPSFLSQIPAGKKPLVFVIDGTWASAKKMLRLSPSLLALPHVSFIPKGESQYQFRRQPKAYCFSTLEAIERLVGLLEAPARAHGLDAAAAPEAHLSQLFLEMVSHQVSFTREQGSAL